MIRHLGLSWLATGLILLLLSPFAPARAALPGGGVAESGPPAGKGPAITRCIGPGEVLAAAGEALATRGIVAPWAVATRGDGMTLLVIGPLPDGALLLYEFDPRGCLRRSAVVPASPR